MYPSLSALGQAGRGGAMVSPVTLNAPGGVNAQRGYMNMPGQAGMPMQPPMAAMAQPSIHPNVFALIQWLKQHRGARHV